MIISSPPISAQAVVSGPSPASHWHDPSKSSEQVSGPDPMSRTWMTRRSTGPLT